MGGGTQPGPVGGTPPGQGGTPPWVPPHQTWLGGTPTRGWVPHLWYPLSDRGVPLPDGGGTPPQVPTPVRPGRGGGLPHLG